MTPADLPLHLKERTRERNGAAVSDRGAFVLYWMHHAARDHDNPALDAALWVANRLALPVLVYQGLGGRHPYNSDRHHTFILQGAREVQASLHRKGIAHVFHLGRDPDAPTPLSELGRRAALLITEDFPAPPFPAWTRRLATALNQAVPVWCVDTHCMVPMQQFHGPFDRAFRFRNRAKADFAKRVRDTWTDLAPEAAPFSGDVGFDPIDLATADLEQLCAECRIDHAIGPVAHTPGGSSAGYHRWGQFKQHGLRRYARLRNDAAVRPPAGVSRLSPYLHHGHVSPMRIAREAALAGGDGAEKFLDELLIWRELAHNFCFFTPDPETIDVLPEWAQRTLDAHRGDPRPACFSWETMARGKTGDTLWDLAQQSLLIHGELHNNVRMTWGKAILNWTESPEAALAMLIDLNHRYALDGNDPNSYGGLLWCLGLSDRPFKPEKPIIGSLRPRPTEDHARRLNLPAYRENVAGPAGGRNLRVGVIGAGMSGLFAARTLSDHGHAVRVFEKSRGPGGRMATRRMGEMAFDHGAQYLTVRDERFRRYTDAWQTDGILRRWDGKIAVLKDGQTRSPNTPIDRFVGVPGMSRIARHLAGDLHVDHGVRIASLERADDRWTFVASDGRDCGTYDAIVLSVPAPQCVNLLGGQTPLADTVASVRMAPCWALMVFFDRPLPVSFDGAFIHHPALSWAARNTSKPERPDLECWVLHARGDWSKDHLDASEEMVSDAMRDAFFQAAGLRPVTPVAATAHRWRYATAENPLSEGALWDPERQIAVCGDWLSMSRVEGAFLSGMAAAGRILCAAAETS